MIRLFGSGKISEKYMKLTTAKLKRLIKEELQNEVTMAGQPSAEPASNPIAAKRAIDMVSVVVDGVIERLDSGGDPGVFALSIAGPLMDALNSEADRVLIDNYVLPFRDYLYSLEGLSDRVAASRDPKQALSDAGAVNAGRLAQKWGQLQTAILGMQVATATGIEEGKSTPITKKLIQEMVKNELAELEEEYTPVDQNKLSSDPEAAISHLDTGLVNLDADYDELQGYIDNLDTRFDKLKVVLVKMLKQIRKSSASPIEAAPETAEFSAEPAIAEGSVRKSKKMSVTGKLLQEMVKNQIKEMGAPAAAMNTLLNNNTVEKVLIRIKDILATQGEPGAATRKEELTALFSKIGIQSEDLLKLVQSMRTAEKVGAPKTDGQPGG